MKFCSACGSGVELSIPAGDNRHRFVCVNSDCATIHYQNPRIITGCIPTWEDKVLLCRRAIEPRYGLWTLPAGFMENGETTADGALRESMEEAKANCKIDQLYVIYDLPHINQVYFFFRASLLDQNFGAGEESLEVALFAENDIPWDDLAFPVVTKALQHYYQDYHQGNFIFRNSVIERKKQA